MGDRGRDGDDPVAVESPSVRVRLVDDGVEALDGHLPVHRWFFVPVAQLTRSDYLTLLQYGGLDFVVIPYVD